MASAGSSNNSSGIAAGQPLASAEATLLDAASVLEHFGVDEHKGLSNSRALAAKERHGANELAMGEPEPLWRKMVDQFQDPMIGLLLGSALLSLLLGNVEDAVSIFLAVVIVAIVAFVQEYRSDKSLEALKTLAPPTCHVMRSGVYQDMLNMELVPGDIVHVATGDRVPADVRLVEAVDLDIDEASLTGEAQVSSKHAMTLRRRRRSGTGQDAIAAAAVAAAQAGKVEVGDKKPSPSSSSSSPSATKKGSGGGDDSSQYADLPLAERANIGFMGTLVTGGRGVGVVIGTGAHTELGKVFSMMQDEEEAKTPLQERMDNLGKYLSYMSFGVIAIIMVIGLWQGQEWLAVFTTAVSLAVAAIPEGLPVVVTVTLALGVLRMSRRQAVVKKLPAVEALGCTTVVCVDKTGTLTQNQMTVIEMYTPGSTQFRVTGVGYSSDGGIVHADGDVTPLTPHTAPQLARLLECGKVCNNAVINDGAAVGQATEAALVVAADKMGLSDAAKGWKRTAELPFSSSTKWMAVRAKPVGGAYASQNYSRVVQASAAADSGAFESSFGMRTPVAGAGAGAGSASRGHNPARQAKREAAGKPKRGELFFVKGALTAVLERCTASVRNHGDVVTLTPELREEIQTRNADMARQGLRVLALATGPRLTPAEGVDQSSTVEEAQAGGLTFLGMVGILDPPRRGVLEAVAVLRGSGVRVTMITGDAMLTANTIAQRLGLVDADDDQGRVCLSGREVETLSAEELAQRVKDVKVFYRAAPKHKVAIVRALQDNDEVVAMTGDGVNDAPALRRAQIGIAMGLGGTDVAKEAADMILLDDNFATILPAVEEGKGIYLNTANFVRFQLSTSMAALGLVAVSSAMGLPNPLNAMQILWINIIMDGPPAQSLGVEPVDADVMRGPPMQATKPVVSLTLIRRMLLSASMVIAGTLWVFTREMADGVLSRHDTTMAFTVFVMFDMWLALGCRSNTKTVFSRGLFSNRFFLIAVGGSIMGQLAVIYFPPLQSVFQTVPLSLSDWAIILPLTCSVWIVDELRKLLFPETPSGTRVVASATGAAGAGAGAGAGAHVA